MCTQFHVNLPQFEKISLWLILNTFHSKIYFPSCSSNANPPFWIPIHIVIPERPTESTVFNVTAGIVCEILLGDFIFMLGFTSVDYL